MTKNMLMLILMLLMVLVLLPTCRPIHPATVAPTKRLTPMLDLPPTDTPIATSTPLSPANTPLPTATAQSAAPYQATAWISLDRPGWGSVQTVFAKLTQGGQGVAGARMYSIVHDQDGDHRLPGEGFEITGDDGSASVSFIITDTPEGQFVNIDVYFVYEGITYHTGTSFAPQC